MSPDDRAGGGRMVLVVDDDASVRSSVSRTLEMHGYGVETAGNAYEARQRVDAAGPPDLILMDLVLPGMEGREAANLLLARYPDVKVVFMSGFTSQESMRMGSLEAGREFLRKPFEVPDLLRTVERALG